MNTQNSKSIEKALELLIERINEMLNHEVPEEIEKYKKAYAGAISVLGELNASLDQKRPTS